MGRDHAGRRDGRMGLVGRDYVWWVNLAARSMDYIPARCPSENFLYSAAFAPVSRALSPILPISSFQAFLNSGGESASAAEPVDALLRDGKPLDPG